VRAVAAEHGEGWRRRKVKVLNTVEFDLTWQVGLHWLSLVVSLLLHCFLIASQLLLHYCTLSCEIREGRVARFITAPDNCRRRKNEGFDIVVVLPAVRENGIPMLADKHSH
jgi:hypothetical protein